MELKNAVAVVTGASGGIGEAVARDLHHAGARLVLTARSADKLERLAADLGGAAVVAGEATDPALPDRLLGTALDTFGRADVLVNNAGMMHVGTVETIDLDKVTQMVRLNVEALFRATYVFLRHFKARDAGYVVNVSSIAGLKTGPTLAAYSGTKYAVEAFTDALRVELAGTGVGMAAVAPGTVDTNLYAGWDAKDKAYIHSGGALQPADIARCVRFILEQPPHVRIPRLLAVPAGQPV